VGGGGEGAAGDCRVAEEGRNKYQDRAGRPRHRLQDFSKELRERVQGLLVHCPGWGLDEWWWWSFVLDFGPRLLGGRWPGRRV